MTLTSHVPQLNIAHQQGWHLPGSELVLGFVDTKARREPLLTTRIQAPDSPDFNPIRSGADLSGKKINK